MTARVQTAAKVCEKCDAKFERRQFASGRLEDATKFADRRFCSRKCYREAAADGAGSGLPSVWIHGPHQPNTVQRAADGSDALRATARGYPWDRKQAPRPAPVPGPFPADRQMNFPKPRQETP